MNEPFWGLREAGSKGMRFNVRKIWHYFTFQKTWARGTGMFSVCQANWNDSEYRTLEKRFDKPPRTECCAGCHAIFNKLYKKV